jgi:hypothetical protein
MKTKNVVFSKNRVRIINGEYSPKDGEKVLINPEYPKGVSPNYWKLDNNEIKEMDEQEKHLIDLHHVLSKNGYKEVPIQNFKKSKKYSNLQIILISAGISCLINIIFRLF